MNKVGILLSIVVLLCLANFVHAERPSSERTRYLSSIWQRPTLTNGFFGLNDTLADTGIELQLSTTQIYQQNVRGGISTHRRAGRYSGSYDLELSADLQKLLGIEGASVYMLTEGVWSKSAGIDAPSVGSVFGVNGDSRLTLAGMHRAGVRSLSCKFKLIDSLLECSQKRQRHGFY